MSAMRRLTCEAVDDLAPLYVLGALDPAHAAAVRAHLAECRAPHEAVSTLGGVVPYLAESVPQVEPPPVLAERLRAAVAAELRAQRRDDSAAERLLTTIGASPAGVPPATAPGAVRPPASDAAPPMEADRGTDHERPAVIERRPRAAPTATPRRWRSQPFVAGLHPLFGLAAVLLVAVLVGWNLLLQGEVAGLRARDEQIRQAVAAAGRPDAIVARIAGAERAPGAGGFAVMTPGEPGYLVVSGLPAPPVGRTYQAWYIENGTPRSAGLIDVGRDGTGVMRGLRPSPALEAVALSQERAGGAPTPGEVYAVGEIGE